MKKTQKDVTALPRTTSAYDDGNIPDVDLPGGEDFTKEVEPLPESERPRKDGPGGA